MATTRFLAYFPFLLTVGVALATTTVGALYVTPRLRETGAGWRPCDPSVEQWSGYFDIPGATANKHYFYWAFGPRNKNPKAPVLLWMTGGPGCSSMLALLAENGPCLVNETSGELYNNTYSWNNEAYVIYIDQPAGVGFSTADKSDYDTNEKGVSEDMYHFLQAFFGAHKNLQKNDFFVVGESYGGHFAPATAYRIVQGNRNKEGLHIRLAGLGVGNGLTDSYIQYASYPKLAWDWCMEKLGKPCVSKMGYLSMRALVPSCQNVIRRCNSGDSKSANTACVYGRVLCNPIVALFSLSGLNYYDIRKPCIGTMCYNFDAVNNFMNREDVQRSLGVKPQKWKSCSASVNLMFGADWLKNFDYTVPVLLEEGVHVMIYAGDMDFICNWIGNKDWTTALEWPGKEKFNSAPDVPFSTPNNIVGGLVRSVQSATSQANFSFVQVYDAGHMVPMDQPEVASAMINKFLQKKPLV